MDHLELPAADQLVKGRAADPEKAGSFDDADQTGLEGLALWNGVIWRGRESASTTAPALRDARLIVRTGRVRAIEVAIVEERELGRCRECCTAGYVSAELGRCGDPLAFALVHTYT